MWVTHSRMLCSLPRSCLVLPSFWQWRVVQLWPGDIFNCVSCFLVKKHAAFKWKDAISGFPVSPGSAEALVRCGGKIKYILIVYFLDNIYAKNCRNWTVYVKIIASCKGGTFFETECRIINHQNRSTGVTCAHDRDQNKKKKTPYSSKLGICWDHPHRRIKIIFCMRVVCRNSSKFQVSSKFPRYRGQSLPDPIALAIGLYNSFYYCTSDDAFVIAISW